MILRRNTCAKTLNTQVGKAHGMATNDTVKKNPGRSVSEAKKSSGNKRKPLSKAFTRPLDKKLKHGSLVRDCFSFPEAEYAHLVALKKRLLEEGVEVKKSELVRAGLVVLSSLEDADMKALLAKVPRVT
jgi:hypothetical protein